MFQVLLLHVQISGETVSNVQISMVLHVLCNVLGVLRNDLGVLRNVLGLHGSLVK